MALRIFNKKSLRINPDFILFQ